MNKINLIVIVLFLFLVACNNQNKKTENKIIVSIAIDTLQQNLQQIDLEIEEKSVCFDTLKIVSSNCILYYPFGKYDNIENFLTTLPAEKIVENIEDKIKGIYHIQFKNNDIEVIVLEDYCENNNVAVNIVNAEIRNDAIEVLNCVKIGISKQSFVKILNLGNIDSFKEIRVIEFISVLSGIWHYYTFGDNNILTKIEIKSDYVFE
jgi:hypothetical protein